MKKGPIKYAVFNIKGGVGKSTIAVHIAHGLALKGKKVLLIDLDGQNDDSLFLGFSSDDTAKSIYDLLLSQTVQPAECILHAREKLDLLPCRHIEHINESLYKENDLQSYLTERLRGLKGLGYDTFVIDCGPRRNRVNDAILYYVDRIIVPVQVEAASVKAVGDIFEYLTDLGLNSSMISLVIPNMYDQRTSDGKENLEFIRDFFSESAVVTEPIYRRIKITETGKLGKTVFETDKNASRQFGHVVERMVRLDGGNRK